MSERIIITEQNHLAIVECHATYGVMRDVADPVVLKLRIVARRLDGTGHEYVARLEPCLRDLCRDGGMRQCEKPDNHITVVDAWLRHIKTYCHGWHEASVRRFMREALASYGAKPKLRKVTDARRGVGRMADDEVAEALGVTADEYRAVLANA
jgi:hypothetical protein